MTPVMNSKYQLFDMLIKSDVRLHMPLWPYTFRFSGAHERDTRVLVFPHAQNVHTQPGVEF